VKSSVRWNELAEVGTSFALRFGGWFHRSFGRRPSLALAVLTAFYFNLRNAPGRRASARYLARVATTPGGRAVLGASPGWRHVLRHFREIAICTYDRMVVYSGAIDTLKLEQDGTERIFDIARTGRGALLLGAHVGNLDLLGFVAREHDLRINIVAHFDNAERVNAFFETLGASELRLIALVPGSVRAAMEIRACIGRGEIVVVMADRTPPGVEAQVESVDFFGRAANFPLGPFLLAGVMGCPVYFALCVRSGDGCYTGILRPISHGERIPRAERDQGARRMLVSYVSLLEEVCERYPYQWFNFFDFWEEGG
jgi:predicted LPLAT superfamily acyltransferase